MHFFYKENLNFQLILYQYQNMSEEDYYKKMLTLQAEENIGPQAAAPKNTLRSTATNVRCH